MCKKRHRRINTILLAGDFHAATVMRHLIDHSPTMPLALTVAHSLLPAGFFYWPALPSTSSSANFDQGLLAAKRLAVSHCQPAPLSSGSIAWPLGLCRLAKRRRHKRPIDGATCGQADADANEGHVPRHSDTDTCPSRGH